MRRDVRRRQLFRREMELGRDAVDNSTSAKNVVSRSGASRHLASSVSSRLAGESCNGLCQPSQAARREANRDLPDAKSCQKVPKSATYVRAPARSTVDKIGRRDALGYWQPFQDIF